MNAYLHGISSVKTMRIMVSLLFLGQCFLCSDEFHVIWTHKKVTEKNRIIIINRVIIFYWEGNTLTVHIVERALFITVSCLHLGTNSTAFTH